MAIMLSKTFAAFRAANVPEEQAREAAEEIATYEAQLGGVRSTLKVHGWILGFHTVLLSVVLWRIFELAIRLEHSITLLQK